MVEIGDFLLKVLKPGQYLGNEINSIHKEKYNLHTCFIYPDLYEVGMSNMATQILYYRMNEEKAVYCERAFSPNVDMEEMLRKHNKSLFSLETKTALKDFDMLAFTLSYEMTYTNIFNILDLSNIPFERENRSEEDPIIIAGGSGAYNPEIMEKYIDIFVIGEGEEVIIEITDIMNTNDISKDEKLKEISKLDGVYVPKFYNGEIIQKRIIKDLDKSFYPSKLIIPYVRIVHDRMALEIQRGCTRGCRFCQAGMICRPVRERSLDKNIELIDRGLAATGYNEVSLSSLSSSDYSMIEPLVDEVKKRHKDNDIAISLPSLRVDNFSLKLAQKVEEVRKTGFTFAPEAGSQRMRDVINKGIEEKEVIETAIGAFKSGWQRLKFYFMIGLPFETLEDVEDIYNLSKKVLDECMKIKRNIDITVSVANFVPKANTPFQWSKQMGMEEMKEKHKLLWKLFDREKRLNLKIHDRETSYLEGFLSRGDEKIGDLIKKAWENGAKFDGWREHFDFKAWTDALDELGLKEEDYLGKKDISEELPWDKIDCGVSKEYLKKELEKAKEASLTEDCRDGCTGCNICQDFGVEMDVKKE
ncbi:MAG: TIGR03960 family B12-binding radical SAM protein, partial [Fusobacteriota bacterium]